MATVEDFLKTADDGLYKAKDAGKNCVYHLQPVNQ